MVDTVPVVHVYYHDWVIGLQMTKHHQQCVPMHKHAQVHWGNWKDIHLLLERINVMIMLAIQETIVLHVMMVIHMQTELSRLEIDVHVYVLGWYLLEGRCRTCGIEEKGSLHSLFSSCENSYLTNIHITIIVIDRAEFIVLGCLAMSLIALYAIAILFLPDKQIANGVALLISLQQGKTTAFDRPNVYPLTSNGRSNVVISVNSCICRWCCSFED
jgi:hypothetical protein